MAKTNVPRKRDSKQPMYTYLPKSKYKPRPNAYTIHTVSIPINLPRYFRDPDSSIVEEIKANVPSLDNYSCTHLHCHFILQEVCPTALRDIANMITQTFPKHMCGGHFIAAFAYPKENLIKVSFGKGDLCVGPPSTVVVGYKR